MNGPLETFGAGKLAPVAVALGVLFAVACSRETLTPTPVATQQEPTPDQSRFTTAKVVGVIDGTTIEVEVRGRVFRVRYLGVEVPDEAGPSHSERALEFNRYRVEGKTVELEKGLVDIDASGRQLRYVYVDGEMLNVTLLANGYAVVAAFPSDFTHKTLFSIEEESAKRDQRGLWKPSPPATGEAAGSPSPVPTEAFGGGTLPLPPGERAGSTVCDFSASTVAVIKGNVDSRTGEHIYHVPGGLFYSTTVVSEGDGDRWFCTEDEAISAGWKKSKR